MDALWAELGTASLVQNPSSDHERQPAADSCSMGQSTKETQSPCPHTVWGVESSLLPLHLTLDKAQARPLEICSGP